jgi:hypothetical protein
MSSTPNMSYCQFRNTVQAVRQCRETLEALFSSSVEDCEDLPLSRDEHDAAKLLVDECISLVLEVASNISGSDIDLREVQENTDELLDNANMLARRMRHSLDVAAAAGEEVCKRCGGSGVMIVADAENGPEFDSEAPCECEAGERLMREQNEAQDRERDEFENAKLVCRRCKGPRDPATGCTNGLCITCHRAHCSDGGATSPGHNVQR